MRLRESLSATATLTPGLVVPFLRDVTGHFFGLLAQDVEGH